MKQYLLLCILLCLFCSPALSKESPARLLSTKIDQIYSEFTTIARKDKSTQAMRSFFGKNPAVIGLYKFSPGGSTEYQAARQAAKSALFENIASQSWFHKASGGTPHLAALRSQQGVLLFWALAADKGEDIFALKLDFTSLCQLVAEEAEAYITVMFRNNRLYSNNAQLSQIAPSSQIVPVKGLDKVSVMYRFKNETERHSEAERSQSSENARSILSFLLIFLALATAVSAFIFARRVGKSRHERLMRSIDSSPSPTFSHPGSKTEKIDPQMIAQAVNRFQPDRSVDTSVVDSHRINSQNGYQQVYVTPGQNQAQPSVDRQASYTPPFDPHQGGSTAQNAINAAATHAFDPREIARYAGIDYNSPPSGISQQLYEQITNTISSRLQVAYQKKFDEMTGQLHREFQVKLSTYMRAVNAEIDALARSLQQLEATHSLQSRMVKDRLRQFRTSIQVTP